MLHAFLLTAPFVPRCRESSDLSLPTQGLIFAFCRMTRQWLMQMVPLQPYHYLLFVRWLSSFYRYIPRLNSVFLREPYHPPRFKFLLPPPIRRKASNRPSEAVHSPPQLPIMTRSNLSYLFRFHLCLGFFTALALFFPWTLILCSFAPLNIRSFLPPMSQCSLGGFRSVLPFVLPTGAAITLVHGPGTLSRRSLLHSLPCFL